MSAAALMLLAWAIEMTLGWPNWVYKRVRHPVVWFGTLVSRFERVLNRKSWPHHARYLAGMLATVICISVATSLGWAIAVMIPPTLWGITLEALIASSLIASRSLYAHVAAVAKPLNAGDVEGARVAVSMIVGRDPSKLDEAGVARAGLESLAENTSDGVTAPLFWGVILGLPGLAAYKAINTLDSMIGHKTERYAAFGGFAARLDDIANLIPARLTGFLFAITSGKTSAFRIMFRDARRHRSPNAGWPEAAMAGALGVRLSGPRAYEAGIKQEPWLNRGASDPTASDMARGLRLYRRTMGLSAALLLCLMLAVFVLKDAPWA
ncbi:MAG: adenosylcobinamide-phosphate synthase CbiB [Pseudomonadota bacterium]